ncbi:MAG: hypothetical protein VX519_06315 [Myxococcota bacterium]|nr:hypothetical protein [Myxococcota bacterium]
MLIAVIVGSLLLGCKPSVEPIDSGEPEEATGQDTSVCITCDSPCESPLGVTWESYGQGFFQTYCNACHSSTTEARNGAPEGVDFDQASVTAAFEERIRVRVLEEHSMPVGGGVPEEDLVLLEDLLVCLGQSEHSDPQDSSPDNEPQWSVEEVLNAVSAGLQYGLPDPYSPRDTFLGMFVGRDSQCPSDSGFNLSGSFNGCLSSTGYRFAGTSAYEGPTTPQKGPFHLIGDFYIIDNQAQWFRGGGELLVERVTGPGVWPKIVGASILGSWSYDGDDGWLGGSSTLATWIRIESQPTSWTLELDGSFGFGEHYMVFEDLLFDSDECGGHPKGRLGVRGLDGQWYHLDFGQACSGCAEISTVDTILGEGCIDLRDVGESLQDIMRLHQ